jgi:diketogulonate reductase-like aldo/keto reductase
MLPKMMYGTAWKEDRTEGLVGAAIAVGFTAIDTANQRKHYHEAGVGAALASRWARGERKRFFLQTKYTFARGQDHRLPYDPDAPIATQVAQSFASSLEHLGVERIDSYLLHGPSQRPGIGERDVEAWRAMERLLADGKARHIGVSNVTAEQLAAFVDLAEHPITFVQNRCYATLGWDAEVRALCARNGITYQGFSLLTANRPVWNGRVVADIARAEGITPAQVIFAWALHLGIVPLTGTTDARHMTADRAALDIALPRAALDRLEQLSSPP